MTGRLMRDVDIKAAIKQKQLSISTEGSSQFDLSKSIQASSLDLRVGKIYRPPSKKMFFEKWETIGGRKIVGGRKLECSLNASLNPGETILVETNETVGLSPNIAAVCLPPAFLARDAILTTNHGHVDPGYIGTLSFTLINMGREPYILSHGDRVATLLFYKFDDDVENPYKNSDKPNYRRPLEAMSPDFAGMNEAIAQSAKNAVSKELIATKIWTTSWATLFPAFVAAGMFFLSDCRGLVSDSDLEPYVKIENLNSTIEALNKVENRIYGLPRHEEMLLIQNRIIALEREVVEIGVTQNATTLEEALEKIRADIQELKNELAE